MSGPFETLKYIGLNAEHSGDFTCYIRWIESYERDFQHI
jgi:hypothetical protein